MKRPTMPKIPAKTREVFDYLKICAAQKRLVTYGEVGKQVGLIPLAVNRPLYYIWTRVCETRRLPHLNAIVVNKGTRRPGVGYQPNGRFVESEWQKMVKRVFDYDWSNVEFDF